MRRNVWLNGIFILLAIQVSYGLTSWNDFKDYRGYEIKTVSGVPQIVVYTSSGSFPINIDGSSLVCEYVMARLLNMKNTGLKVNYEAGTPAHYRFTYWSSNAQNHFPRNMGAIGFYESAAGGITLEVFFDANGNGNLSDPGELTPTEFVLNPGDSPKEKLKFDYLVSSLVSYFMNDGGSSSSITIVPGGIKFNF